jgi:hypothetical protein
MSLIAPLFLRLLNSAAVTATRSRIEVGSQNSRRGPWSPLQPQRPGFPTRVAPAQRAALGGQLLEGELGHALRGGIGRDKGRVRPPRDGPSRRDLHGVTQAPHAANLGPRPRARLAYASGRGRGRASSGKVQRARAAIRCSAAASLAAAKGRLPFTLRNPNTPVHPRARFCGAHAPLTTYSTRAE